jgi:hypothetical protein
MDFKVIWSLDDRQSIAWGRREVDYEAQVGYTGPRFRGRD